MDGERGQAVLAGAVQWAGCSHTRTALLDGGGVALTWADPFEAGPVPGVGPVDAAGLAVDRWSRAYRSRPAAGRVDVVDLGVPAPPPPRGGPGALHEPRGLAVDDRQRLYVAETGGRAVHVVDLVAGRLLRRIPTRTAQHPRRRPVDVAAGCCGAAVLLHDPVGVVRAHGRRGPFAERRPVAPPGAAGPVPLRIALRGDRLLVLWPGGIVAEMDGSVVETVEGASGIALTADGVLVVARGAGGSLRRFRSVAGVWPEIEPLGAPGHDGGAITVAPDGRIAFTTAAGVGWTSGPDVIHPRDGRVVTFRLDAGSYRTRWGRVFLDACVPAGSSVRLRFLTSDDDRVDDPLPHVPAERGAVAVPAATPTLPSRTRLAELGAARPVHRRRTGREWPWAQIDADDRFETYEVAVAAPPGRYLWIVVDLAGNERVTPRIRALRAERPGHRLLDRLPRAWSRAETDASFLHRFLTPAEGMLHELDERAASRDVLVDAEATPQEALAWLAGLAGLVLDRRWPEPARRTLVAEAFRLFRVRGTSACLERILELYLGFPAPVMENWRLRGLGGAVLGVGPGPVAPAVGARAGSLGHFTVGGQTATADGYSAAAHRFTVLVPTRLSAEQRDVVAGIVAAHKPAHTVGEICELGGMRVGRQLHLDLTAVVGPPGPGWSPAVTGQAEVGSDAVVGVPALGSRVGATAIAGAVRVG